ncbi:MAG: hypothetical protein AB1649_17845 [Chloroflexota bacterium]
MKKARIISAIRWLCVPLAAAGYLVPMLLGLGFYVVGNKLCPADQMVSGVCTAPWFLYSSRILLFVAPSIGAIFIILGAALIAPSNRRLVALLALAAGAGYALPNARGIIGLSFGFSIIVGACFTAWLYRCNWTRGEESPEAQNEKRIFSRKIWVPSVAFIVVFGVSFAISNRQAMLSGPKFRNVSQDDVPRLMRALESREHPVDAVFALGRLGRSAAPAVPLLIKLLDDPKQDLVMGALIALERIGPEAKAAVPDLKRFIKSGGGRWGETRAAIKALGGIGDGEAIMEVVSIDNYQHEYGIADAVRNYPIEGLGLADLLVRLFNKASVDYVKESAAIGLARLAPQTPGLVNFLGAKLDAEVKGYAESFDKGARMFHAGHINELRTALEQIGTQDARVILQKHSVVIIRSSSDYSDYKNIRDRRG